MGIVTKLAVKLFPKMKLREVESGLIKDPDIIPKLILKVTHSDICEDILLAMADKPDYMKGYVALLVYIRGDSQETLDAKIKISFRLISISILFR